MYNYLGLKTTMVRALKPLQRGKHQVRMEFQYAGGETPGQGGTVTLFHGDTQLIKGVVPRPIRFSSTWTPS